MFDFIEPRIIYLVFHLIGLAMGAGGAFMSDAIFLSSIRDRVITSEEFRFMKLASKMVWSGLIVLTASGIFLFLLNVERYMSSTKFMAKIVIVLLLAINGAIFHALHIPALKNHLNVDLGLSKTFQKKSTRIFISGAVSLVSWIFVIVLGAFRAIPYDTVIILAVYVLFVILAAFAALAVRNYIFKSE